MPRFKCQNCRTRFYSAAYPPDVFSDLCSKCGSMLVAVPDVRESLSMGSITARPSVADAAASVVHESVPDRLGHVIARREVARAQARLDGERWAGDEGERWADDGGSFTAEPLTTSADPLTTPVH
ncbi:MAG: hypothetical protein QOE06_1600 [Thermoleophilaceae bacterium]|jgi:hypothetical protein|nr:hypothetical protein [Thermoleophilaceae bacterium]